MKISISDSFDGGNINFIRQEPSKVDPDVINVILHIKPDIYTELESINHMQYFSFRVIIEGPAPQRINYVLENADKASYPEAWSGTTVFYSHNVEDPDSWKRIQDTFYTHGKISWEYLHESSNRSVYFSYYPPYSYSRHLRLIAKCEAAADRCGARVFTLGKTLQGRELECINIGSGDKVCWIIHRQHPGEAMAEHYAEGLLTRLLAIDSDQQDDQVNEILQLYTFYIVPCMCPDGAALGHLRTNAVGSNLNREWNTKGSYAAPTPHRSPEVYYVRNKMDETGVDCFLDIHGDEELPFNFISGAEHVPNWGKRLESLHGAFVASYVRANSDMQQEFGYPAPESPEFVLNYMNVATNQVCHRFDCLAMTLEMPFKDCLTNSDPEYGWSPARARRLAETVLDPLMYVHPYLRAEGEFWTAFPQEDSYVETTDDYQRKLATVNDKEGFIMLKKRFYSDVHEVRKREHVGLEIIAE